MAITEDSLKQITDLSIRIFQQCDQNGQNEIVSPLSLIYILAAIAEGAEGNTLTQIEILTGMKADELLDVVAEYQHFFASDTCQGTNIANALVIDDRKDLHVKKSYLKSLSDNIAPHVFKGKDCVAKINQWADKETFGMIESICDKLPDDLIIDLLNAVAFNESWLDPYEDEDIYDEIFTSEDGSKEKTVMMHSVEEGYFEDDEAVGFAKEYQEHNYSFLALLPKEGIPLSDYIQSLIGEKLSQILNKIDYGKSVKAAIPVFTTDFKQDMGKVLQQMGVTDVFDPDCADLSNMAEMKEGNIYLNGIQQTAHITVDREGTRAAAVTEGLCGCLPDFSEPKEVILDKPFLYMIVDNKHKIPVFIGAVRNIPNTGKEDNGMEESKDYEQETQDVSEEMSELSVDVEPYTGEPKYDYDEIIFKLDSQIDLLSSQADGADYLVAIASGILCSMLDILWCGEIDLKEGQGIASDKVDNYVMKIAKKVGDDGKEPKDIADAISILEDKFPIANDGNTPEFGGGGQHHLRDFGHHPTIIGLFFSLLTQFFRKSYGIGKDGKFHSFDIPKNKQACIGDSVPEKIVNGTFIWFFHLVSDMAGSNGTRKKGNSEGTGIPGPILSLAEELSRIPLIRDICIDDDSIATFIKQLFNGNFLEEHYGRERGISADELKLDLRGELGLTSEMAQQAIPVAANECLVRTFYFIRHLGTELQERQVNTIKDILQIDWANIYLKNDPTIARMLTIATGVFTTIDIGEAVASGSFLVSVNYTGVGKFAVAIGEDISWSLRARNVEQIKKMYQKISRNTYREQDDIIYRRVGTDMSDVTSDFGLTQEQTEILYNVEYCKVLHDMEATRSLPGKDKIQEQKKAWADEWKQYMTEGFSSFLQEEGAELTWYTQSELIQKIAACEPEKPWFRLMLLEAMLFEPYYPLSVEKDKKGNDVPSKKYNNLQNAVSGYQKNEGDNYLDIAFAATFGKDGYVKRLRKCYDKCTRELNETLKTALQTVSIAAVISLVTVTTAGALAGPIATALVGSSFAGLSGAALTGACLAYLGGGAVAAGGAGIAGGVMTIVGGGAILGIGVGGGVGTAVGAVNLAKEEDVIMQSAKLMVSVREIFLNDEHDLELSNTVYEQYLHNIVDVEDGLVELRLQADVASGDEKKQLLDQIKQSEKNVEAMKIARKSMLKYNSAFEEGMNSQ